MNQAYIIPFFVSTVAHVAVIYSVSSHVTEPRVFVPQASSALEICIEGSICESPVTPVESDVVEEIIDPEDIVPEPVQEPPVLESFPEVVTTVTNDVPVFEEQIEQEHLEIVAAPVEPVSQPKKEMVKEVVPQVTEGNSTFSHVGSVGSDTGCTEPELIYNPTPVYPRKARRLEQEGMVIVMVAINSAGSVIDAYIDGSSGFPLLDSAALKTVQTWRFIPAQRHGKNIATERAIPFVFKLK